METIVHKATSAKLLIISLLSAVFIVFPNIAWIPWDLSFLPESKHPVFILYFCYRYVFFFLLIWMLLWFNLYKISSFPVKKRFLYNLGVTCIAYLIYVGFSSLFHGKTDCFGSILMFQFFVICIANIFVGHVFLLYSEQQARELEIEQLKSENLQSRCDALSNQINPHFFFNSLNGLSALIRKKDDEKTQAYINKLSDVFRYILQSDKKGLVSLKEELAFVESFRYMMEVRFANKLEFHIHVDEADMQLKIPVLSVLPLIDNVVMHNTIDSDHLMAVTIRLNEQKELVVSNPIYPKRMPDETNGTGLRNLENRFDLLVGTHIRVEKNQQTFNVYLPLK